MKWPRWIKQDFDHNLREVAPGLYVGAEYSAGLRPDGPWQLVVDLYGSSRDTTKWVLYWGSDEVMAIPFDDGDGFPDGALDRIGAAVMEAIQSGPVLIHCQAGLSRSASAAYAMLRTLYGLNDREAASRVKIMPAFPRKKTLQSARDWVHARDRIKQ